MPSLYRQQSQLQFKQISTKDLSPSSTPCNPTVFQVRFYYYIVIKWISTHWHLNLAVGGWPLIKQDMNFWCKFSIMNFQSKVSVSLCKKATIQQVTTMLATSENVLFPGHNHLLTTSPDDPTLWLLPENQWLVCAVRSSCTVRDILCKLMYTSLYLMHSESLDYTFKFASYASC